MKVVDPGHIYLLDELDDRLDRQWLCFVKRVGEKYPGNEPPAHPGTTTQEVLRSLIDRMKYVDRQRRHELNDLVLYDLRKCLYHLELRASRERGEDLPPWPPLYSNDGLKHDIENEPTCPRCGHIRCGLHQEDIMKKKLTEADIRSWTPAPLSGVVPKDIAAKMKSSGQHPEWHNADVPHEAEFVGLYCDWQGGHIVRWAALDTAGRVWERTDGTWVPSMSEEERRDLAARISALIDEANAKMREAGDLAEEAGLTFRMRADAEFHGFPAGGGDEWYGGWESSYC